MKKLSKMNLPSIVDKINEIIDALPRPVDLKPIKDRLSKLESVKQYDDSKIKSRLSQLEAKPGYNDWQIRKEIKKVADSIPPAVSLTPVVKRLEKLESVEQYNDKSIRDEIDKVKSLLPKEYNDTFLRAEIKRLKIKVPEQYNDKWIRDKIRQIENKPQDKPATEKYDDSELMAIVKSQQKQIDSLLKKVDYLKRTYSEKWAVQQIEIDKAKSIRDEIDKKIDSAKSDFTCSCDAQSALKVADYTRRTMTEKYTAQQFQIDKIQSMLSK